MRVVAIAAISRCWTGSARILRVFAYALVVCSGLLAYGAHSARGAIGERSLALGRELERMRDLLGTTKTVTLNGQQMMLSTAVVPLDVHATLDRFEQLCRRGPNGLAQAVDQLPQARAASAKFPVVRRLGILRSGDAHDGVVSCIVHRGDQTPSLSELVDGLSRTMDLGLLGDFFYVYVRDASSHGKTQSHVITSWTHGSFRPAAMFPASGDSPGSDSTLAARPASSRRILSGVAVGAPYGMRVYESDDPASAALTAFDASMAVREWTRIQQPGLPEATHAYIHSSGVAALATAARSKQNEKTIFSLVEMGAGDPRAR